MQHSHQWLLLHQNQNQAPRQFAGDIHGGQVEHFEQGLICGENALSLRDFTELAVVAFDHIDCVDQLSNFWRVLEEGGMFCPVVSPGTHDKVGICRHRSPQNGLTPLGLPLLSSNTFKIMHKTTKNPFINDKQRVLCCYFHRIMYEDF